MDDAKIANLVRTILDVHPEIRKATIAVAVRDGEVTLTGTIRSPEEGIVAEDISIGISGVRSVRNLLLCDEIDQVEDARISHDVEAALKRSPGLRDANLRAAFDGETLVLTGSAAESWQKELAGSVADRFRPRHVRNEITTG
jgi:osmotically-inducible protein OsmY